MRMRHTCSLAILAMLAAGAVRGEGIDTQNYKPCFSQSGYFTVDSPRMLGHFTPNLAVTLDYGKELLVARDAVTGEVLPGGVIVDSRLSGHLTAALGLWDRAEVGFRLPVVLYQNGSLDAVSSGDALSSTVPGDLGDFGEARHLGGRRPGLQPAAG